MPTPPPDVKTIFGQALELPDPARGAFLDRACAGDAALRAEVEGLLAALDQAGGFLSRSPAADGPTGTAAPDASTASAVPGEPTGTRTSDHPGGEETVGAVIGGRYKLVEGIGEGGMGSVFLAQQSQPVKRLVAVKVIKAGMDSKAVLARFDAERQALAMMDHPNIAKVLDAGTTETGRPFFVMELVKGVPITQFCDDRKLTPRQRLELFVPVCHAIQHAHQKGVIHRDIKPFNVLVSLYDDRPVPKVIDFGVAKAAGPQLTDHTLVTGLGAVVGTPEYMSPEQASFNQLDVDTRSDIYALGVLLYELLTGTTPIDRKSLGKAALLEVLRMVREVEAPRPSNKLSTSDALPSISANRGLEPKKLTGLLRGELDWIVMKALEKDRARRYETATGFAADVQRYLAGEQVQAVPPSASYRLRKFLRKNRGPMAVAGAVLLALTVGMIGTGWGLVEARSQRDNAETARDLEAGQRKIAQDAVEAGGEAKAEETKQRVNAQNRAKEAEVAKADALRSLYDARILALRDAWENGNVSQARALLEAMRPRPGEPDLRGFEWHYLDRQVHGASGVLVTPMVDGKRMYALPEVYDDGRLLLFRQTAPNGLYFDARSYDTATGRPVEGYKPIQGRYQTRNPGFSSTFLSFAYRRGESGSRFLHYHTPAPPSGRLWETNRPTDLSVYDARTGEKVADVPDLAADPEAVRQGWQPSWPFVRTEHWFHLDRSVRVSVLTRAKTPASPTDSDTESRLRVHDIKTGRVVATTEPLQGGVHTVRFSPDGHRVLTVHSYTHQPAPTPAPTPTVYVSVLSVWDAASGKRLWFNQPPHGVAHAEFSGSGREVLLTIPSPTPTAPDHPIPPRNTTLAFDAATGTRLPARSDQFVAGVPIGYPLVTRSPDGRWVAVANRNRVDLRDVATGIAWRTLKTEQPVHAAHFLDDGRTLRVIESLSASGVRCSSLEVPVRPKPEETKEPPPSDQSRSRSHQLVSKSGTAWSLDLTVPYVENELLAAVEKRKASDWSFRLRDARTGDVREIAVRADLGHFNKVGRPPPAFSEDGRIVALSARPAPETGKEKEPPDGRTHHVGIAVLDFNERKLRFVRTHAGHDDIVPRLSPDGQFLAYVHDRKLRVCDTRTDREIWAADLAGGTSDGIVFVEFSPDGKRLAVGMDAVTIYNSETGAVVHTIPARDQFSPPPRSWSHSVGGFWSNDGRNFLRLADGQLRSWEVGTWAEVARLDLVKKGEVARVLVFSPDHQYVAVGCRTAVTEVDLFQVYAVATGRRCLAESDTARSVTHAVFGPDSSRLFLVHAPEKQAPAGNPKEPVKTMRVHVCDYRRDLYSLAIDTPIPETSSVLKLDASDNKVVLWFGAGETFTIDATPRTAAEVAATRRPVPSEVEVPDARVGPVLMTRPTGDLHAKFPQITTLYTKDPKTASNYADVAVSSSGEPAVRAWREAIRLDPDFAPLHHELALALKSNNKPDEAVAAFRECLRIDPRRVDSQHQLGLLLFHRGEPKEAIGPLREAVRLDPQSAAAFNDLGCCLRDTNDIPGAITAFESAVALQKAFEKRFSSIAVMNSTFARPHRNLGELFVRQRNLERSVAEFKDAVRFNQYDAGLYDLYGCALRDSGKTDEAVAAFQKAIQLNPGYAQPHRNLGWVYGFVKKDFEKADAAYRKARGLAPKDAGIFNDHGCLLRDNGKVDEGLAAFDRATELAPKFWLPYRNRGHTFLARNQPERAAGEFRKAIEADPRMEAGYNDLAVALVRAGRTSEGVQILLTATKEHPELATSAYPWVYNAACIAVLGGTSTDAKVTAGARAALRKQALGLLRMELASQKKDYEADPVAKRGPKHQWMAHWLTDSDFNGVRSPEELALLPKDEQKAWQELWTEIRRFHEATVPEVAPPPREKK